MKMRSFFLSPRMNPGTPDQIAFDRYIYFIHTIYASNALIVNSQKVNVNSSDSRLTLTGLVRQQ
jgi:hypothetical protein